MHEIAYLERNSEMIIVLMLKSLNRNCYIVHVKPKFLVDLSVRL